MSSLIAWVSSFWTSPVSRATEFRYVVVVSKMVQMWFFKSFEILISKWLFVVINDSKIWSLRQIFIWVLWASVVICAVSSAIYMMSKFVFWRLYRWQRIMLNTKWIIMTFLVFFIFHFFNLNKVNRLINLLLSFFLIGTSHLFLFQLRNHLDLLSQMTLFKLI